MRQSTASDSAEATLRLAASAPRAYLQIFAAVLSAGTLPPRRRPVHHERA